MDVRTRKTLATRLSSVLLDILVEGDKSARIQATKGTVKVMATHRSPKKGAKARIAPKRAAKAPVKTKAKAKANKGGSIELKPCPVTGIPNKYRRFSYLMPEARTPENLAKFKGSAKKSEMAAA